jgi:GTP cyclohydrolase I
MTAIRRITWEEVRSAVLAKRPKMEGMRVYGVPRGGCAIAPLFGIPVDSPDEADLIVDDLIDSGATRDRFAASHPCTPFLALFERRSGDAWLAFPWEENESPAADAVVRLIEYLGDDPQRPGLIDTPDRVLRALKELTSGNGESPENILARRFAEPCDEMVVVRGIEFWSLCEHHLLPFRGEATVGYLPNREVVGLSKLARLVQCFARRLQVQERMTTQIAQALFSVSKLGAGCIIRATHTCMAMRGARATAPMVTSALYGSMREGAAREEFLRLGA